MFESFKLSSFKLSRPLLGFTILMLLGFIWGTGYSIARFAMTNGVPPLGYSFWQSLGPALIVGLVNFLRQRPGNKLSLFQTSCSQARFYLICGLTGIVIPNTCMYFSAQHLPASILVMVVNTVPIIAYPMALLVKLESFNWQRMFGILLAFCGLMAIILPTSSLPSRNLVPWVLLTLITPISFAVCTTFIACFRPKSADTLSLTAGMLLYSSLLLIPLVALQHSFYLFHFPFSSADEVIILEIILSSIGYLLFFQLIKVAGPVYYSLVDTIVVLTGIFWGHFLFGEQLNEWTKLAVFFILFALFLVTRQQKNTVEVLNLAKNN